MIELRSKVKGPYVAIAVGMSVIALSAVALIPALSQEISISARINNYLSFIGMLFR